MCVCVCVGVGGWVCVGGCGLTLTLSSHHRLQELMVTEGLFTPALISSVELNPGAFTLLAQFV